MVQRIRCAFQFTPSTASPGKSIVMKKDGPKSSPSLFITPNLEDKTSGKKNVPTRLTVKQSHMEAAKIEESGHETSVNSAAKTAVPNSEGEETKAQENRQAQKGGKTKQVNGKRKLQVCKCLFSYP